jgi:hypothetical protein
VGCTKLCGGGYFTVSAIVGHCKCCAKLFAARAPSELKDRDNIPLLLEDKKYF